MVTSTVDQVMNWQLGAINSEAILPLLAKYRPQLWREIMIDRAIAEIDCTPEEIANACQGFYGQAQIPSDALDYIG